MAGPAVALRIIFGDETDSRKLPLMSGIPVTVELHVLIKTFFQLKEEFRLQYMDADFKEFMNLTSVSEIEHKSTLKVICLPALSLVMPQIDGPCITLYPVNSFSKTVTESEPQTSVSSHASSCSDDAQYTSTPHSSTETL